MAEKDERGARGEALAADYLEAHGYLILERNVRLQRGEIDIVAREGGDLVFVEVKTRTSQAYGTPAEAITPAKARRLGRAIQEYLQVIHEREESVRVDVVGVMLRRDDGAEFELIRNAIDIGDLFGSGA